MFSVDGFCIRERMGWLCRELSFILRKSSFEWVDYFLFVQETICDKNKNFFLPRCCVNSSFNNCSKPWHAFFPVFLNFSIILPGSDETRSSEKRIFVLLRNLFNQRFRHCLKNCSQNAVTIFLRFTLHRQRKAMPPWNKIHLALMYNSWCRLCWRNRVVNLMKYFKTMNAVAILTGNWVGHGLHKIFAGSPIWTPVFS